VASCDLRGAGTSQGKASLLSDREGEDVHDLIEWAAAQPWSTGAIGLIGVSYLAISQWKAAALNPPGLKAICPWEGFTDAYPVPACTHRQPLVPGQVVQADMALGPSATFFRAGETLRLVVAGRWLWRRSLLTGQFPAAYQKGPQGRCTVHWGPEHQARLLLPIVRGAGGGN
jgi:predicted acyl esterase